MSVELNNKFKDEAEDGNSEKHVEVSEFLPEWDPTPQQQRRVLRKIDLILIPLMCGCVLCKFL